MKIAISTAVYYPMVNGVAVFAHSLALGLAARGHQVIVLCPSQTKKSHTKTEHGVKVHYLKSIKIPFYPDQINAVPEAKQLFGYKLPNLFYKNGFKVSVFPNEEIKKILDQFQPDVIHCQISDPIGLSVVHYARKNHIPVVTTEHNQPDVITDPLKIPKVFKKPADAALASYFRNRQKQSDFVTMPTQQAIDLLFDAEHPCPVPVRAVSNGVDLANFSARPAPDQIYQKYHLDKNRPTVLYIGRVDPEKQVGLVISAFSEVLKKLPEAQLVIVGDGVDRLRLENLAKDLGIQASVKFLGRVLSPDLYELYRVGDVFVTASEIETQGIVLIEAAASGLPLVAVDAGAVNEIVVTDENGYLCEPKNVPELAAATLEILTNQKLRERFAKTSQQLAARHDFEHTLDAFEDIYRAVTQK